MTEFAHTYDSISKVTLYESAAFTLILHRADGKVQTVNSNEVPAYADEDSAIRAAMFAVKDYDDSCDVYHFGAYHGTAEYVDMTPESWFDHMEVVFSMPYYW